MMIQELDHRCGPNCCHWSEPLNMRDIMTIERVQIRLSYEQWLLYHLHVVIHQGGLHTAHAPILIVSE